MNDKIDMHLAVFAHMLQKVRFSDAHAAELVLIKASLHRFFEDTVCYYLSKVMWLDRVVEYQAQGESYTAVRHNRRDLPLP